MADSKNNNTGFWLTMIPAIILGTGESLGEVTILGYIATFKGNYVSGFNVGSAMAGLSGSFLSLLLKDLHNLIISMEKLDIGKYHYNFCY